MLPGVAEVDATGERLLTSREVGELFGVAPTTVARWADEGRLPVVRTPSGRRRYRIGDVARLLTDEQQDGDQTARR
jgi:excisionase family DNA binding protein